MSICKLLSSKLKQHNVQSCKPNLNQINRNSAHSENHNTLRAQAQLPGRRAQYFYLLTLTFKIE